MAPVRHVMINTDGLRSMFDRNFGIGLLNDNLLHPHGTLAGPIMSGYIRPWGVTSGFSSGTPEVQLGNKDGFKVNVDVQQFKPEEVNVKVVDNCITVEGNHEERLDEHGFVTRQFKRRYILPKEIEHEAVSSTLSSDGVLTIQAPKKLITLEDKNARVIPIVCTQAPAAKQSNSSSIANGGVKRKKFGEN